MTRYDDGSRRERIHERRLSRGPRTRRIAGFEVVIRTVATGKGHTRPGKESGHGEADFDF